MFSHFVIFVLGILFQITRYNRQMTTGVPQQQTVDTELQTLICYWLWSDTRTFCNNRYIYISISLQ